MLHSFYKGNVAFGSSIGDLTFTMNDKVLLLYLGLLISGILHSVLEAINEQ